MEAHDSSRSSAHGLCSRLVSKKDKRLGANVPRRSFEESCGYLCLVPLPPLLHQEHLARAFDRAVQASLIVGGETGVFAWENAAVVGHKLPKEIDVLEIKRVDGEVDFGLRPR